MIRKKLNNKFESKSDLKIRQKINHCSLDHHTILYVKNTPNMNPYKNNPTTKSSRTNAITALMSRTFDQYSTLSLQDRRNRGEGFAGGHGPLTFLPSEIYCGTRF